LIVGNSALGLAGMLLGLMALVLSHPWRRREKAIALALWAITLVATVTIVEPIVGRGSQWCGLRNCKPNSGVEITLALAAALIPLAAMVYLAFRATRRRIVARDERSIAQLGRGAVNRECRPG
jgi:hypothetical protein